MLAPKKMTLMANYEVFLLCSLSNFAINGLYLILIVFLDIKLLDILNSFNKGKVTKITF